MILSRAACVVAVAALSAGWLAGCGGALPPVTYAVMPAALTPVDAEHNKAKDFAKVFCSTLPHLKDKDGSAWGDCAQYLDAAEPAQTQAALSSPHRFLFVSGIGADCMKDVRAFSTSIAHLKEAHHIDIEYFAVAPFGASSENGTSIAKHIEEGWTADKSRRYVLVGYDKGAADLLESLRAVDAPKTKVAALVTVAGAVGGSWAPDAVRALIQPTQQWMAPGCPGNVQDGIQSLTRELRQRFLRENPLPVPGYSIVATSTLDDTSSVLQPAWKHLSVYSKEQDSQLVAWEAVLPGAKYLGAAHADHWAIALPFDESSLPPKLVNRNHFPRDALLEAIVRFVTADLNP
jgi:hypothetical protein